MNTLLIIYEVGQLTQLLNQRLIQYLQGTGMWARISTNIWLIKTTTNAVQARDDLRSILSSGMHAGTDKFVVINVTKSDWASFNLPPEVSDWMKFNI